MFVQILLQFHYIVGLQIVCLLTRSNVETIFKYFFKFHPLTFHEGTAREEKYTPTYTLISVLDRMGGQQDAQPLYRKESDSLPIVQEGE